MATTDANGQVFYGPTDPVTPIQGLLNGISTAVSSKLGAQSQIARIANVAGRAGAVAARSGRPITVADPLIVWRGDITNGDNIEFTTNGTTWANIRDVPIYARSRSTPLDYTSAATLIDFPNTEIASPTFTYAGGLMTCVIPGTYTIEARVNLSASGLAVPFETALMVNGSVFESSPGVTSTLGNVQSNISRSVRLAAGNTVGIRAFSTLAIGASIGGQNVRVQAVRLGN